jgi:RNA polymerase sigma-70 factor (ECF subfamily)
MPAALPETSSNAAFPTSRWSQVVAAGDRAGLAAREALAELCSAYWYPLYAFVRRKGHPPDEAADLVQGTFLTLLDRDGLAAVAPERGRFRSFLMAACSHHLADCRDRDRAVKRGGGALPISIDRALAEDRYSAEPVDELTAERLFDRCWATRLLDRALARLAAESIAAGKSALVSRLLPALTGGRSEIPLAANAAELGMTEGSVKMAASRLRKRHGEILREEIARTAADPADVDAEVRAPFAALAR